MHLESTKLSSLAIDVCCTTPQVTRHRNIYGGVTPAFSRVTRFGHPEELVASTVCPGLGIFLAGVGSCGHSSQLTCSRSV